MDRPKSISRRRILAAGTAGIVGAALPIAGQNPDQAARPKVPADPTKVQGPLATDVGSRSPFERPKRVSLGDRRTSSLTPLQDLDGIITPADLHFERHHGGVPAIDPKQYSLLIHGMVERPLVFTLDDLRRFPGKSIIRAMECSGNGGRVYRREGNLAELTPQQIDGLTSTSEWTACPWPLLREPCVAQGPGSGRRYDAAVMTRSIRSRRPGRCAVAADRGEPLRPEQGAVAVSSRRRGQRGREVAAPHRAGDQPFMTREETSKYTDPLPDGTARIFSLDMDAKSLITEPSFPDKLTGLGWWEIRGIAWSGRGKITRVDVSGDGGRTWQPAKLDDPVYRSAARGSTRREWKGGEA
jgi:sulfane dehydrogenase subunit SoxC